MPAVFGLVGYLVRFIVGISAKKHVTFGLTLTEMVIALSIITVIFAAILPQFRVLFNSWDGRVGDAEAGQNGRVLAGHINNQLSKAKKITAVSVAGDADGFIEFEDDEEVVYRYEVGADGYVRFGEVGNTADLAGPVSGLEFECFSLTDFDNAITDVEQIRFIKIHTTVTNSQTTRADKSYTMNVRIESNADSGREIIKEPNSTFEFNSVLGAMPAIEQIDDSHYLCVYTSSGSDGWACVIEVDQDSWFVEKKATFEFDSEKGTDPSLVRINSTDYLCVYCGDKGDGWAVILSVSPGSWTVSMGTPFEFDPTDGSVPAVAQIDYSHYLCVYAGVGSDGWAVVLDVDPVSKTVSTTSSYEFEAKDCSSPALIQVDQEHYLCAYEGPQIKGMAVVLDVDPVTYSISAAGATVEYNLATGKVPSFARIDSYNYLCAYTGLDNKGYATIMEVNPGSWGVSTKGTICYDETLAADAELHWVSDLSFLCVYTGPNSDGWSTLFTVDSENWTISNDLGYEFDPVGGRTPCISSIDGERYLVIYQGSNNDGWAAVLSYGNEIMP